MGTIQRVFQAIEYLTDQAATASDVARHIGVNRSTALRLLNELMKIGYVDRDPASKQYRTVAARFSRLVGSHFEDVDPTEALDPILSGLRDKTKEAVMLGVPASGTMVYLSFFPSRHAVAVRERLGTVRDMHCSALGRAYLASLDVEELDQMLGSLDYSGGTSDAPPGPIELRRRIDKARSDGFAVEQNETSAGVSCVATAIRIHGKVFGAIGVSGPTTRFTDDRVEDISRELVAITAEMTSTSSRQTPRRD